MTTITTEQLERIILLCFRSRVEAAEHIAKESGRISWSPRNFLHYSHGRPIPGYVSEIMGLSLNSHKRDVDRLSKSVKMA